MLVHNTTRGSTMKTVAALSLLVAGVSAFAPAAQHSRATTVAVKNALSDEIGSQAPLGFWDPMGFCIDGDKENFNKLREYEIRHGRVAMLAVVGWLTTAAGVRFPGLEDVGFGLKAFDDIAALGQGTNLATQTWLTVIMLTIAMQDITGDSEFLGDYRNGIDFGWDKQSDQWKERKRAIELNNGRAAQMGIMGIVVHELMGNLNDIGLPQP